MIKSIELSPGQIQARIEFDKIKKEHDQVNFVFVKCRSCKGTGLVVGGSSFSYTWDGSSYCEKCRGFGGEFISRQLAIECDECKGFEDKKSCSKCGGSGYVDWIENIVGQRREDL